MKERVVLGTKSPNKKVPGKKGGKKLGALFVSNENRTQKRLCDLEELINTASEEYHKAVSSANSWLLVCRNNEASLRGVIDLSCRATLNTIEEKVQLASRHFNNALKSYNKCVQEFNGSNYCQAETYCKRSIGVCRFLNGSNIMTVLCDKLCQRLGNALGVPTIDMIAPPNSPTHINNEFGSPCIQQFQHNNSKNSISLEL